MKVLLFQGSYQTHLELKLDFITKFIALGAICISKEAENSSHQIFLVAIKWARRMGNNVCKLRHNLR